MTDATPQNVGGNNATPQNVSISPQTWTAPSNYTATTGTNTITYPAGGSGGTAAQFFTAEDIEKARREERDKLYGRISKGDEKFKTLEEEISALRQAAADRENSEKQAREAAAELERQHAESELSAKQLIETREKEWQDRFADFQRKQELAQAAYERDKQHLALKNFIERRAREELAGDHIADELIDFINGNSEAEVEESIVNLRAKTQSILENIRAGQQQLRAGMPGVSNTSAPPAGAPLDNITGQQRDLSPEEIRNIPMSEWHKHRAAFGLTSADSNQGLY